jgi:hypothetical protein
VGREPEKALAFAREQGVDLAAPYARNMVVSYLNRVSPKAGERLLLSLRGKEGYNPLIIGSAGLRLYQRPTAGVSFISQHAKGDWQQALVDNFKGFITYNHFVKTEPFAQALSSLELTRLEPTSVVSAASMVLNDFSRGNELQQGMNWTLKLPPSIAATTRERFVQSFNSSDQKRRTVLVKWLQSSAIQDSERASLMATLNN